MKGMLLKDIFLLKELKKMVFLFAAVSIMMLIGGGNEAIVLGYFNVLMLSVAMNSTSYDDYNNGYSFLFTLPITRKEYVKEKYIFGFLVGFSGWLFTVVITSVSLLARGKMKSGGRFVLYSSDFPYLAFPYRFRRRLNMALIKGGS